MGVSCLPHPPSAVLRGLSRGGVSGHSRRHEGPEFHPSRDPRLARRRRHAGARRDPGAGRARGAATPRAALDPYVAALGVFCSGDHDGAGVVGSGAPTPADHDGHGDACCLAACLGGFPAGPALAAASAPALVAPRLVVVDRLIPDAWRARPTVGRSGFDARGPPRV
ncbi:hypothetical protein [Methyloraptor flagellatus]|uniref:Uncharacterized protein n=1 Tax=Methyloraptor flagellatus TaxID=3162530 RepID=A0AAU7XE20_9HYPH